VTDIRPAEPRDVDAIAAIHAQGIAGRRATFHTEPLTGRDVRPWLDRRGPLLVAEEDGEVVAWASVGEYSDFPPYADVGEFAVYVAEDAQRRGLGRRLLETLCEVAERDGRYKLVGKLFTQNEASLALCRACGFREVGVHRRHGRLDGVWRDVIVVERLLGSAKEE
jgi:L-amino acid N-acyltransferase YncA